MPLRPHRMAFLLAALLALGASSGARAADEGIARLKRLQQQMLLSEPAEKLEKIERFRELRKKARKSGAKVAKSGQRRRPERLDDLLRTPAPMTRPPVATRLAGVSAPPNRQISDGTGEPGGSCQSEVSIAAIGNRVVAAWNDGIFVYGDPFPPDAQGFAYSSDGGLTWTDGGPVPNGGLFLWASDPVVVANPKTGAFYYCGLMDFEGGDNGIAVVKGTFNGSTFSWQAPTIVEQVPNAATLLDKEWMAVDSLSGNLYISYSSFAFVGGVAVSNSIRFERSTDDNQTWTSAQTLSAPTDAGLVQGSRPAVGPDGEVYVTWHAIGQISGPNANSPFGRDFLRIRKSTNGGASFAGQVTADSVFSNFGTGAPGFNRGIGITFPGIAVDAGTGPDRGRVYLSWNESLNFYNDPLPEPDIDTAHPETENNNGPSSPGVKTFNPVAGEVLRGTISTPGNPGDHDYWKWNAVQGQTVIFYLDSLDMNLDAALRIFCSNQTTNVAFSQNGFGGAGLVVFTVPTTDTYYMRVASYTGTRTGRYRVLVYANTPQTDRARDHRDLFVKSSANGTAWGATTRVNDSPPTFDDWLPEVQVDRQGRVFVAAYDWRDSPALCGGGSNVYLYRSDNAGGSWTPGIAMTDATTNWTATSSSLIPNQGDYIGLHTSDSTVFVSWGDGRNGDPDVFMTSTTLNCSSSQIALGSSTVTADSVVIVWSSPGGAGGTLQRRLGAGAFVDLGPVTESGGQIVYVDTTVTAGASYTYRIAVVGFCEQFAGTVSVSIPGNPQASFGIELVSPNPTSGRQLNVDFRRTGSAPAYIELIDVSGRHIIRLDISYLPPIGRQIVETGTFKPGLYFVRLVEGSQVSVRRVSILP